MPRHTSIVTFILNTILNISALRFKVFLIDAQDFIWVLIEAPVSIKFIYRHAYTFSALKVMDNGLIPFLRFPIVYMPLHICEPIGFKQHLVGHKRPIVLRTKSKYAFVDIEILFANSIVLQEYRLPIRRKILASRQYRVRIYDKIMLLTS